MVSDGSDAVRPVTGRWVESAHQTSPDDYGPLTEDMPSAVDLPPGHGAIKLVPFVKWRGESDCYVFSALKYAHNPTFRVPAGTYSVMIDLRAAAFQQVVLFTLNNQDGFGLTRR